MSDGIDVERVTDWLAATTPPIEPPLTFELIAGGRSNLTYRVTDAAGRKLVLRRPPLSHVLASAHDMGREHRLISALHGTAVPVPTALGFCDDEEVNGAPFYVMDFVDGHVLRGPDEAAAAVDEATRARIGANLVDVLVRLHEVDVDAVGLGELSRRDSYVGRQLKRWYGQFQHSQEQERASGVHRPAPIVDEVHQMLSLAIPPQQGVALVHGDYRLDNTIVGDDGEVRAVLDWELATLGDPLADVGTLIIYWADDRDRARERPLHATGLPGFPGRDDLARLYAERSSLDLSELPYYVAFGHWKLACIMEGVYARFASGAMGAQESDATTTYIAQQVIERATQARDILAEG